MLSHLKIENVAVIEKAEIGFENGLNIKFSGYTSEAGLKVYSQSIKAGTMVDLGSSITVSFMTENIMID